MPEEAGEESSSPLNGCSLQQDAAGTQSNDLTAGGDQPNNQNAASCSQDSAEEDPEVIYDDVAADNLQHLVEGASYRLAAWKEVNV